MLCGVAGYEERESDGQKRDNAVSFEGLHSEPFKIRAG